MQTGSSVAFAVALVRLFRALTFQMSKNNILPNTRPRITIYRAKVHRSRGTRFHEMVLTTKVCCTGQNWKGWTRRLTGLSPQLAILGTSKYLTSSQPPA
eukprot:1161218-Pelagomonas_calceolata.AAC.9